MSQDQRKSTTLPVGVVIRRQPGVTRWARHVWKPVAVLPGAPPAKWKLLREDGDTAEFHADTVDLVLYRGEAESYKVLLSEDTPSIYVVLREADEDDDRFPYQVQMVTASAHEGQLFQESGDEIVERVPMPEGLIGWIAEWVEAHYVEEPFVKRKRRKHRDERVEEGIGDPRISQVTDVYRAPSRNRKRSDA